MKALFVVTEVLTLLGVGLVLWVAAEVGMLMNFLALGLMAAGPILLLRCIWNFTKGPGLTPFWKATSEHSAGVRTALFGIKSLLWVLCGICLDVAIIPSQLGADYNSTWWTFLLISLGLISLEVFSVFHIRIVRLIARVLVELFLIMQLGLLLFPSVDGPEVVLDFPMRGEWVVFQGGGGTLINHHSGIRQQRHALDLSRVVNGRLDDPKVEGLSANYSFDQVVYAPVTGTVVQVVDAVLDNEGPNFDPDQPAGNHVIIRAEEARYVTLAHLKRGSVEVNIGDTVEVGMPIARIGNSGNTTAPHMHLQVNSEADFLAPTSHTFPMHFRNARVDRGGASVPAGVELRRNDRILVDEGGQ